MAPQSSELFTNNLWHLMDDMKGAHKELILDLSDEIIG
jgi:NAD/NADP transhydrogenase alpha subunit